MHFEGEQHYYETRLKQEHAHIVCLRCGSVQEFFGQPLQQIRDQIKTDFGFQILVTRTEVGGYCADCQDTVFEGDLPPVPENTSRAKHLRPARRVKK